MRAILQRVSRACVTVEGQRVGAISKGLLILVAAERGDGEGEVRAMASKLAALRIFEDAEGKMNLSAKQAGAEMLVVSQFTLASRSLRRGHRPSFSRALAPEDARPLVESLMARLEAAGFRVEGGRFGAMMEVELINDGPVTFVLDCADGRVE